MDATGRAFTFATWPGHPSIWPGQPLTQDNRARSLDRARGTFVAEVALAMSTLPQATVASPLPIRRVSVADRVARSFPPLACVRGFRYFARKRVDLVSVSEQAIEADVKGKRTLRVILRVDDGHLASACSCSAKVLGPAACRHVWATLLEIDRRGALESLRTTQRSLALGVVGAAAPASRSPRAKTPAKAKARAKPRGADRGET